MSVLRRQALAQRIQSKKIPGSTPKPCESPAGWLSRSLRAVLAIGALSVIFAYSGVTQTTNGLITGTISDPTGAVVPGATITVTNLGIHLARSVTSDDRGYYAIIRSCHQPSTVLSWPRQDLPRRSGQVCSFM